VRLHPRASGIVAAIRQLPGGAEAASAALAGDIGRLARFVSELRLRELPPALVHHLALFHGQAARALEGRAPDAASNAWVHALSAWLVLAEERAYVANLEDAVLGSAGPAGARARVAAVRDAVRPESVALELVADLSRRSEAGARALSAEGRAALMALARTEEAAKIAEASPTTTQKTRAIAERRRTAAIGEALDEATVRGELAKDGGPILLRAIPVWTWTSFDEAVEQFVVDRIDKIGWELYRARNWDALQYLLGPFRPMFDSLASRIEKDPSAIAYAAGCAQMFVFLAEVTGPLEDKLALAERSLRICPTHRNGRLVLAAALSDQATDAMRGMTVFAKRAELDRVEALLARAESLYPQTKSLPAARANLDRIRKQRILS
jgi:hypothetical protein